MAVSPGDSAQQYEFRINGRLDRRWESWFNGLTVIHEDDDTTTLRGHVTDQSALHGVLGGLRDLGVILISVRAMGDAEDLPEPRGASQPGGDGTG
jgi:hypothetical protein